MRAYFHEGPLDGQSRCRSDLPRFLEHELPALQPANWTKDGPPTEPSTFQRVRYELVELSENRHHGEYLFRERYSLSGP